MTTRTAVLSAAAVVIAALAWIDPLFIPLVTLGPIASGVAAGLAGERPRAIALVWFGAGLLMLVSDLAINGEDAGFHAVVALVTAAIAAGSCRAAQRLSVRRRGAVPAR